MPEKRRSMPMGILEVLTIGFPFCGFKILAGLTFAGPAGFILVAWGILDALINATNLAALVVARRRAGPACLCSLTARVLRGSSPGWQEVGNSLDVLVAFALVAVMIGAGKISSLPPHLLTTWNVCVILNVLGAGLGRFGTSVLALSHPADAVGGN